MFNRHSGVSVHRQLGYTPPPETHVLSNMHKFWLSVLFLLLLPLGGCATPHDASWFGFYEKPDPLEKYNRAMTHFNLKMDRAVIRPVAQAYTKAVPAGARDSVSSFFSNLTEPTVIVNDVLQAKFEQALADSWRFAINSTVGVLGLFDVSSKLGLEKHHEDFGQTFALWGLKEGPYLVLPLLGPSNVRDTLGLVTHLYLTEPRQWIDDRTVRYALFSADLISRRAQLIGPDELISDDEDSYLLLREAYHQKRENLIYDGEPPISYEYDYEE